jgi:hypothetical protein
LINGSSGIAVGMATNMMPHNLTEVVDGCIAYIENKEITIDELMQFVKAPDFPTGGMIYGMEGVKGWFSFWSWPCCITWQAACRHQGKRQGTDHHYRSSLPGQSRFTLRPHWPIGE